MFVRFLLVLQLNNLQLKSNNLTGDIPALWRNFTSLQGLHLGDNNLYGELPDTWSKDPNSVSQHCLCSHAFGLSI